MTRKVSIGLSVVAGALALALSACGATPDPGADSSGDLEFPDYYPADYADLVAASQEDGGELLISSATPQENWAPILRDFEAKYPWTSVTAKDAGAEMFTQILSEMATGQPTADLVVGNSGSGWAEFASNEGVFLEYSSPELTQLPDFAQLLPNVTAMSFEPAGIAVNTALVDSEITSLADLRDAAADLSAKLTVRGADGDFGFSIMQAWVDENPNNPDARDTMEDLLGFSLPESSGGTQVEKVLQGEYAAGYLVSSAVGFNNERNSGGLMKFVLPSDGTVLLGRAVAIPAGAAHPDTAKLFVDFLLSEEGQQAVAEGGLTAYRAGTQSDLRGGTLDSIIDEVGEDAIIVMPYRKFSDDEIGELRTWYDAALAG